MLFLQTFVFLKMNKLSSTDYQQCLCSLQQMFVTFNSSRLSNSSSDRRLRFLVRISAEENFQISFQVFKFVTY